MKKKHNYIYKLTSSSKRPSWDKWSLSLERFILPSALNKSLQESFCVGGKGTAIKVAYVRMK